MPLFGVFDEGESPRIPQIGTKQQEPKAVAVTGLDHPLSAVERQIQGIAPFPEGNPHFFRGAVSCRVGPSVFRGCPVLLGWTLDGFPGWHSLPQTALCVFQLKQWEQEIPCSMH